MSNNEHNQGQSIHSNTSNHSSGTNKGGHPANKDAPVGQKPTEPAKADVHASLGNKPAGSDVKSPKI